MYDSDAQMIIMVPYQGLYLREEVTQPPVWSGNSHPWIQIIVSELQGRAVLEIWEDY
jgi:hypothetical protein